MAQDKKDVTKESTVSTPPTGFQVIVREFLKDKIALAALIILTLIFLFIFIELDIIKIFIDSIHSYKLRMCSYLFDFSIIHNNNLISSNYSR